jgi:hypothetical protein
MIKIINGVYGRKVGNRVVPVTAKDGPIELTPEQEERLVKKGVAVYVEKPKKEVAPTDPPEDPEDIGPGEEETDEESVELPAYNEEMTRDQLNEIAMEYGIEEPQKARNKAELISWIDEAAAEEPPTFDAADAVDE